MKSLRFFLLCTRSLVAPHTLLKMRWTDEMDDVDDGGTIAIDGDRLIFTLMYQQCDDRELSVRRYPLSCRRTESSRSKKAIRAYYHFVKISIC